MRGHPGFKRSRSVLFLTVLAVGLAAVAAACGGGGNNEAAPPATTSAPPPATTEATTPAATGPAETSGTETGGIPAPIQQPGQCGAPDGQGTKATGQPIKIGGIFNENPAADFSTIDRLTKAYFDCVNDNGGIGGRPIQYISYNDNTDPQQAAAFAKKLIESDKVVGIAGSTSLLDCAVNHKYYEQKGYYVIVAGVPAECFSTPNIAAVNMGPYYSATGAAEYLVRSGAKSIVAETANVPGNAYVNTGPEAIAKAAGLPFKSVISNVPITDGASLALKLATAAGPGGGVVLTHVPPDALAILKGAEQQGLIHKVIWSCATPCNDNSVAKALGSAWNDAMGTNAELNLIDSTGPDNQLYVKVSGQYSPKDPLGSFGQMGFLAGRFMTEALLRTDPSQLDDPVAVNTSVKNLVMKSDIQCKTWYFGDLPAHVPNNTDRTVVPQDGKMVQKEDCFEIDPINQTLKDVRAYEAAHGLGQ
jgi:branched-chain amino acid transport system substrate-binding protein